jgi:hypothetical protein
VIPSRLTGPRPSANNRCLCHTPSKRRSPYARILPFPHLPCRERSDCSELRMQDDNRVPGPWLVDRATNGL